DQEDTMLILFPDAPLPKFREILFIRKTNEHIAVWEGEKYTIEQARQASGIQTVYWNDEFPVLLNTLMLHATNCYLNLNEHDRMHNKVPYHELRFAHELKAQYPLHEFERAAPILHQLRSIKSNLEIALIKTACDITEKAFRRILNYVKPGRYEFEVEAEITHEFIVNRATGHAYYPIVASGKNSCILHYDKNNQI